MLLVRVLVDFSATTGTDNHGYESCVRPHGSSLRGDNSSMLLDRNKSEAEDSRHLSEFVDNNIRLFQLLHW